jgi:acetyl-CoA acetyltransferase
VTATVAIVGAAETTKIGILPNISQMQLHAEAALNALADCGLSIADVDGIASVGDSPEIIANYLGIVPRWADGTLVGGCSAIAHLRHAVAALEAGLCSVVLLTHGQSGRSMIGRTPPSVRSDSLNGQFEEPYGPLGPPTLLSIPLLRYMRAYGLTEEQLAMVVVVQRQWATLNPRALLRDPITVDDVFRSRFVSYPLRLAHCCVVTDGGGAMVLVRAERARDFPNKPAYVLGTGEGYESPMISQMETFERSRAFSISGQAAFRSAGVTATDIDHVMMYDPFAHIPLYGLADLGFVNHGEAGAFVAEGHTGIGGRLPMNTNGGGLNYTHTGMYGMFALQEGVRQVRGIAPAQVPDVKISLVHGIGGMFAASSTAILSTEQSAR